MYVGFKHARWLHEWYLVKVKTERVELAEVRHRVQQLQELCFTHVPAPIHSSKKKFNEERTLLNYVRLTLQALHKIVYSVYIMNDKEHVALQEAKYRDKFFGRSK